MVREKLADVFADAGHQAYRVAEIRGGRGTRAEHVDFLFREYPWSYGLRPRGHADDHNWPRRWSRRPRPPRGPDVTGPCAPRPVDVLDHHLAWRSRHCGQHIRPLPAGASDQRE